MVKFFIYIHNHNFTRITKLFMKICLTLCKLELWKVESASKIALSTKLHITLYLCANELKFNNLPEKAGF